MKCPYCSYDKIQPNYVFCPHCRKRLVNTRVPDSSSVEENRQAQEKGFINRAFSRWTYERAIADPNSYALWAFRNPNDNRVFLERWSQGGNDVTILRESINEALRSRRQNPTTDRTDVEGNVFDYNRNDSHGRANQSFVAAVNSSYTSDAAAIVRNKAIWKLQPGELARHIAPDEWCYVSEHLEGLVIEEGTSAIIYIDGQEVCQMSSGMYVFDDKHAVAAEKEAESRRLETKNIFTKIADGIYRFFTGHKREESASQREERRRRLRDIVGRLKKDTIIDVYLKSDRVFPAIFGQQYLADKPEGYKPYVIQTLHLDVQVGVYMQMQISDFKTFIATYLSDRKTISISEIVQRADNAVYSVLRRQLRNVDVQERGLDDDTFDAIKYHLRTNLANILHGIIVIDVLDITTDSEKLQRFRDVESQLYCGEREYDFLLRTNEFRNRIASEENDQSIREAKSDLELRKRLDEINKDHLIHEDEMEQFVDLLRNQKVIRETQNQSDLNSAILSIQRNNIISLDEFDAFLEDVENQRFDRGQVSEQLRAKSLMSTAMVKMDIIKALQIAGIRSNAEIDDAQFDAWKKSKGHEQEEWDIQAAVYGSRFVYEHQMMMDENADAVIRANHENEIAAIKREERKAEAEFASELKDIDHEREIRHLTDIHKLDQMVKSDEIDLDKKQMDNNLSYIERVSEISNKNIQAMNEAELAKLREQHAHEQNLANIEADVKKTGIAAEKDMSARQLMAKNVASMDASAQEAFAASFSHLNDINLLNKSAEEKERLYQQMLAMAQQNGVNMTNLVAENSKQQSETLQLVVNAFSQVMSSASMGQNGTTSVMLEALQSVANGKIKDAKDMKDEYHAQAVHQQARTDSTQSQALNYTSKVRVSENMPNSQGAPVVGVNIEQNCPNCKKSINPDAQCCPFCGEPLN